MSPGNKGDGLQVDYVPSNDEDDNHSQHDDDDSVVAVDPLQQNASCMTMPTTKQKKSIGQYLQAYVQFMASPLHQDRSLKLLQYTLWMMGQVYGSGNSKKAYTLSLHDALPI